MVTLKQLIYKENAEMKERRKEESSGCYYIFYILTILYTLSSLIFAFPDNGSSDKIFIYTVFWTGFMSVVFLYGYLYRVKENGKFNNIFFKYRYIPVDINHLLLAKTVLLGRKIILHTLPAQILAIIIRIIYVYTDGIKFFNIFLFIPAISGMFFFLTFFIMMYIKSRQPLK